MNEEENELETTENSEETVPSESQHSGYKVPDAKDENIKHQLTGMYQTWFLDYASYVILERAVPHLHDGLKPVQRRILHSMKRMDDGRYGKVANIVGHTMQFHPHGDASIGGALVQLGQCDLLIDCQGNWGNILTGAPAAAPRYIEARLSKFALDVMYNPKITEWQQSYDGRNKEPVTLPVKFPLLLAQGVEGIAVGLATKVLPHNFNELIDASVAYLRGEDFALYPDFQTGGSIDVAKYNDGERGGSVKVRAKINKLDNKTLVVSEIPFGRTAETLIDSIVRANDKGKIKIRKVDDLTAANVEIQIHLQPGTSSDKTIDALYAFTDCEISISPNCCVIYDKKPRFMNIKELLRQSTDRTLDLLRMELEIQRKEFFEQLFYVSLEKIFIENRIYKDKEFENSTSQDEVILHIDKRLNELVGAKNISPLLREITREDILKLLEIKMMRITKFDSDKANDTIISINKKIEEIDYNLVHIVDFTISWFEELKRKYGKGKERRTEIRNFESIEVTKVVEANEKLFVNREEGFIGTGLKKDEFVGNCSDIDDVIVFFKDGKYKIIKVADKIFVGKNILYLSVFKRNDTRTIYNVVYRDGRDGAAYIKRFAVSGVTRDKEYDITQGKPASKVLYFSANPNGEAEVIRIVLKPKLRLKNLNVDKDFSEIVIKGRQSQGNILTKNDIHKITLKQKGGSTLGGRQVYFDPDVLRLNYDKRGTYLGEFQSEDLLLVITKNGEFYTTGFDLTNHFEGDILRIEKFDETKTWSAALFDAEQGFHYIKRFPLEVSAKRTSFLGENPKSELKLLSDTAYPLFRVSFTDGHEAQEIDVEEFISVKSYKAKGKRISTWQVGDIEELEPLRLPEVPEEEETEEVLPEEEENENALPDVDSGTQMSLF
ncbi:MAG: DNA gyrase/topoisomerase IV subunit A [Prevotellaceae bacterium]|nr:DNA gyrase/topoisomerase IV subunit A [Prevotellaceae bacterium]